MDISHATIALTALAQDTRLSAFRLLVEAGPAGLPAGAIASALGKPHNTLSSHLGVLEHARLVSSVRKGRSIVYSVDIDQFRRLLSFLVQDCCQGRPESCQPLIDAIFPSFDCDRTAT